MSDLCPVGVSQDSANIADQPKTAGESHLLLLKQKKYCDVTFTFLNLPDRIQAHEFCLKARSPVFEQIFRMRRNAEGNEIVISEATPERFQQFLEFIYADKLDVDIAGALDLLLLAQKYKIQPLIDQCKELLKTEIKLEESVRVFGAARRYSCQELMDLAGEIMVKSFRYLARMGTLMNAEEETVIYLLQRDDLSVPEVGLFQLILDWGKTQVGTSAGARLLKEKLKNVISKIRNTNMAPLEFITAVVPTGRRMISWKREHPMPLNDKHFTLMFQKDLFNPERGDTDIAVDPPVELIPGNTYSIIVEDRSTFNKDFHGGGTNYYSGFVPKLKAEANFDLKSAGLVLSNIQRTTEYYSQENAITAEEIVMVRWIILTSL